MSKPDWKDAPEWARYLAENGNSFWHWHEKEPIKLPYDREWISNGKSQLACDENWENTLEEKPHD